MKKYQVELDETQRKQLESMRSGGKESARMPLAARILLKADQGEQGPAWTDEQVAEALDVGRATVERVRRRFVEGGLLDALVHPTFLCSSSSEVCSHSSHHAMNLVVGEQARPRAGNEAAAP